MSAAQAIDWSKYEQPATPQIDFSQYEGTQPPPPQESFFDKVADMTPVIGTLRRGSAAIQRWAEANEPLKNSAAMPASPTLAALKQGATGTIADVAGLVHGAASPAGIATTAATIAAPEVMAPALIAHGIYKGVKGWGDLENPDVLQNELGSAAEVAGGAALGGETIAAGGGPPTQAIRAARAVTPDKAAGDFALSIPPTKSTPYQPADYQAVRPYLEAEHAGTEIDGVTGVRDAAQSAIGKIEDQIGDKIANLPNVKFQPKVLDDVRAALGTNQRGQSFVDAGLKELDDFNLDQPKTLADADAIRRQLNLENQAVLSRNSYKIAEARAADPAFAAREAAAESLRNGIYDYLSANGMPEARQLRLDEGSLIKIRNAAQNQAYNGAKIVGATKPGPTKVALTRVARMGGAAAGAAVHGPAGAVVGEEAAGAAANALIPSGLTRDALAARSFSMSGSPGPGGGLQLQPSAVLPNAAAQIGNQ